MKYYVNESVKKSGDGSIEKPFKKIQEAASIAKPGDEVIVAKGIYREHVAPVNSGMPGRPIIYKSEEALGAIITGAEVVDNWEQVEGTVWKTVVSNDMFGDSNPYINHVEGDWLIPSFAHLGDVYLNHKSLYEVETLDLVKKPIKSMASWDPEFSIYTWYCEQDTETDSTIIYANFQGLDPNKEEVEISVRNNCFMPKVNGVNYITLSGFTVREAASQWAPPTAYQDGMIGPHWSKGWVIEDCEVYEAKCSGISLGKYLQPNNDNKWLKEKYKDGTQTERDCICQASYEGWDKDHIGSHIIRRCNIHDCGQTGIVGHLGGVFSIIEDNHIHHINNKQNLMGAEIGGIKMHAAIDVIYRRNHIHHCTRGIWLDWQAQGTRVTSNLFHDNCLAIDRSTISRDNMMQVMMAMGEDLFIEVSHGPTLVDNNIMLSERNLKLATQGVAVVHNLLAGSFTCVGTGTDNGALEVPSPRYTPYHQHHGTAVAGFMTFLHGDCKFYNNIFVQQELPEIFKQVEMGTKNGPKQAKMWDTNNFTVGTVAYDGYKTFEEWDKQFEGYCGMGSQSEYTERYYTSLPIWTNGNVFFNGAKPFEKEENFAVSNEKVYVKLVEKNGELILDTDIYDKLPKLELKLMETKDIPMAFEPEQFYENPDGSPIVFDTDMYGKKREGRIIPGPIA